MWSNGGDKHVSRDAATSGWCTYKNEILGMVLGSAFLFLFLSCISFNPYDRSFFYFTNYNTTITNWCGFVGAEISALLFYLFGSATYLFLSLLLIPSIMLLAKISFKNECDRLAFLAVILWPSVVLCRMYNFDITNSIPGGVLGYYGQRFLLSFFSNVGTQVCMWSLLVVGIMGVTKTSYTRATWFIIQQLYKGAKLISYAIMYGAKKLYSCVYVCLLKFYRCVYVCLRFSWNQAYMVLKMLRGILMYYMLVLLEMDV